MTGPIKTIKSKKESSKNFFNHKDIVLTGITGFIGSSLAKELLKQGANIFAFARKTSNLWRFDKETLTKINWIYIDLCDFESVQRELQSINPDFIYHLATYYSVGNIVDFSEMIDTNIKTGVQLLKACEGLNNLKLFVNTGTCSEYGDLRETASEDSPLNPNSIYASTKTANTIILHQLSGDLGVPLTTLRLYNMYGEFDNPQRIVPYIIISILNHKSIELTGCKQSKDYTYLGDIVNAFLKATEKYNKATNEIFNIGTGNTIQMKTLVNEIIKNFNHRANIKFEALPYRDNEMWYQGTSITKAAEFLNWQPEVSLESGIKATVEWYKNHFKLYEII